jgi:allophanate hydrolase
MDTDERWTVAAIARRVAAKTVLAVDVAREALDRARRYDAIQPAAWILRIPDDEVLERATTVDAAVAQGEHLPLAGVPFAVKDNMDIAHRPTTAACPAYAYTPARTATVVARLEAAGAVAIGKTNLDQFATGLTGTRSPYGLPRCVFNQTYVSGGSSSGSAVVVGAQVVPFALGSDTAGSIRVPAAFNGLVGFKPTRGRWSARGVVPACQSIDCVGVLTMTSEDAALIDDVCTQYDELDPYARRAQNNPRLGSAFRFGVPMSAQLDFLGDEETKRLFEAAIADVEATGGTMRTVDITPLLDAARLLYDGPWVAERTAVFDEFIRAQPDAVHPIVRKILEGGRRVTGVDTYRGLHALQGLIRTTQAMFEGIDLLLMPTTPTIYRVEDVLANPITLNSHLGRYTNFVNLLDLSAIALPAGFRTNRTGFGVSVIAPAWNDRRLLTLGQRLESKDARAQRPELDLTPTRSRLDAPT